MSYYTTLYYTVKPDKISFCNIFLNRRGIHRAFSFFLKRVFSLIYSFSISDSGMPVINKTSETG